ncbi:MAG: glycosyltransferase family 4 protein, partial [Candidatus Bathyarchaeota archaeon]
ASLRLEHGIPEGNVVIGALGRLVRDKRIDDLIGVSGLISKKIDATFLIGGDGPHRPRLQELAEGAENIRFVGEVRDPALFHRLCDVYVLASVGEGLSTSLQEAMAMGCVPVAVRGFGCPELVEDGVNGYMFRVGHRREMAEKVLEAVGHPELGLNARETIRRSFDLGGNARRYIEIYEELV